MCTSVVFSNFSQLCNQPTNFRNISSPQKEMPCPLALTPITPSSQPWQPRVYFLSPQTSLFWTLHITIILPCGLWGLAFVTWHFQDLSLVSCISTPPFLLPSNIPLPGSLSSVYSLLVDILGCRSSLLLAMFFGDDKYEIAGKQVIWTRLWSMWYSNG